MAEVKKAGQQMQKTPGTRTSGQGYKASRQKFGRSNVSRMTALTAASLLVKQVNTIFLGGSQAPKSAQIKQNKSTRKGSNREGKKTD
jgi:hypothetical protein